MQISPLVDAVEPQVCATPIAIPCAALARCRPAQPPAPAPPARATVTPLRAAIAARPLSRAAAQRRRGRATSAAVRPRATNLAAATAARGPLSAPPCVGRQRQHRLCARRPHAPPLRAAV
eukprot:2879463-Prymnesium_polylepis.1